LCRSLRPLGVEGAGQRLLRRSGAQFQLTRGNFEWKAAKRIARSTSFWISSCWWISASTMAAAKSRGHPTVLESSNCDVECLGGRHAFTSSADQPGFACTFIVTIRTDGWEPFLANVEQSRVAPRAAQATSRDNAVCSAPNSIATSRRATSGRTRHLLVLVAIRADAPLHGLLDDAGRCGSVETATACASAAAALRCSTNHFGGRPRRGLSLVQSIRRSRHTVRRVISSWIAAPPHSPQRNRRQSAIRSRGASADLRSRTGP